MAPVWFLQCLVFRYLVIRLHSATPQYITLLFHSTVQSLHSTTLPSYLQCKAPIQHKGLRTPVLTALRNTNGSNIFCYPRTLARKTMESNFGRAVVHTLSEPVCGTYMNLRPSLSYYSTPQCKAYFTTLPCYSSEYCKPYIAVHYLAIQLHSIKPTLNW